MLRDAVVLAAFRQTAAALAYGIVYIVKALNLDTVIFSDRIALAGSKLIEIVREVLQERVLPAIYGELDLQISSFADDCMLYGACGLVLNKFLMEPQLFKKQTS